MKRFITILAVALALPTLANAQATQITAGNTSINAPVDDGIDTNTKGVWTYGGVGGLTASQTALSNWASGGANAIAFDAIFNYSVNMTKGKHLWQNRLELAYGMNFTTLGGPQKPTDKIYLSSLYGYELGKHWYASALLNFNTQFANGFNYATSPKTKTSRFMAPGYLSIGAGFTWEPVKWFNLTLSPATWKATWVLDDDLYWGPGPVATRRALNPYGVKTLRKDGTFNTSRMRNEFGANVRAEVNYDILSNLNLYSRLDLFSNYLERPQDIDVRWDVILTAKVNAWLSANLTVNMIWDKDIHIMRPDGTDAGAKFQVKEVLGVGLQAAF
jgi:hypothetical protein